MHYGKKLFDKRDGIDHRCILVERISPAKAQSEFDMYMTLTKIEMMEANIQSILSYSETINSNVEMNSYDLARLGKKLEKRLGYIEQNQQILMLQTQ